MSKRSIDQLRRDVELRQRNIVYPDTLRNEMRGWRALITSKEPLSVVQVIAMLMFLAAFPCVLLIMGDFALTQFHTAQGSGLTRIISGFGPFIITAVLCGFAFAVLRWRVRRALDQTQVAQRKQRAQK